MKRAARNEEVTEFDEMSDLDFWEYLAATEVPEVLVGLKAPGQRRGVERGVSVVSDAQRGAGRDAVLAQSGVGFVSEDDRVPTLRVRLSGIDALRRIRRLPFVDYVEPAIILNPEGRDGIWAESIVCSMKSYDQPFTPYRTPQGDLISRVYGPDVVRAWARSTGEGVTVGVVGTGVSVHQPQLMNDFTHGQSGGRTLIKDATDPRGFPVPWHDDCGHETKLIGYIAAPLDGRGVAGLAYRADIYSVRVDDDVNLGNDSEDVKEGIARAARDHDVVTLAFGTTETRKRIRDEIEYWYDDEPGRHPDGQPPLFVGAAGTTPGGDLSILFPGREEEVLTVTGSELNGDACETCHRGSKVEFALFAHEPVLHPDGGYGYIQGGGSSQAVATLSAMAALVWSRYPHFTRDEVVSRLREASPRYFRGGTRDGGTGWGAPMVSCAVGGLCGVRIGGPSTIIEAGGTYVFSSSQYVNDVPASYRWTLTQQVGSGVQIVGSNSQSTLQVSVDQTMEEQHFSVTLEATDQLNGATEADTRAFVVRAAGQSCGAMITC